MVFTIRRAHNAARRVRRPFPSVCQFLRHHFAVGRIIFLPPLHLLLSSHLSLLPSVPLNTMASGSLSNNKGISATAKHTDAEGYEMPWYIRS